VTALLFDFFGTLVRYSPSRTEQGYHGSYAMVRGLGATVDYQGFLALWVEVSAGFDRRCEADDSEFSMTEAGTAFLERLLSRAPAPDEVEAFVEGYCDEWDAGVTYVDGVAPMLRELAASHRLAVVSNTHSPTLVPRHLDRMGVAGLFETVVLSVDLGLRKPHPAVYRRALDDLGTAAADAVFIGDSYGPDYAGPRRHGMRALLIDPDRATDIPREHRLSSITDTPHRLR
jgi:putative hydrolase of the HAD superfamily